MHPLRKLRERGPMAPAEAAAILNERVVMHSPVLIKPIVGRELVAITISNSTQSRDDPGKYVYEAKIDARTTLLRWQGTVEGHQIESLELLTDDENGFLVERTVAYRPFPALKIFRDKAQDAECWKVTRRYVGVRRRSSMRVEAKHRIQQRTNSVKAFIFEKLGEPTDVLQVRDIPIPRPAAGEILVRVRLSPVHPSDLHIMRGRFGRQPSLPASPGIECVGTVQSLGEGVSGPALGTRVVLLNVFGSWREFIAVPAKHVVPVPDGVSDDDAAQALVNPVAAWAMTILEHRLNPGDWVAQTAAGSTVGRLVLQLAKSEGFRTINIVRRSAQVPEIKQLGGDVVLTSEDELWASEFAKAAAGRAPSKAIDCVGGRIGATLVRHLAPGGRSLVYGALSSHRQTDPAAFEMPIFGPRLIYSAAAVQGWYLFHWLDSTPVDETVRVLSKVLDRFASKALSLPPAKRHPPRNIAQALQDADGGEREGKPLIDLTAFD